MSVKILLSGASGTIGGIIESLARAEDDLEIAGRADRDRFFDAGAGGDVVVDFSHPDLCLRSLDFAVDRGLPMVIGTTGLDADGQRRIDEAAGKIAICQAANFSAGANLLMRLGEQAAAALGPDFDIEISETHHRRKLDAPSGTALALGEAAARGRGLEAGPAGVFDRSSRRQARGDGEIGYASLRGGDVAGEHTVLFLGPGEGLELTHRSGDRSIFARGALLAARRIVSRPAGRVDFARLITGE